MPDEAPVTIATFPYACSLMASASHGVAAGTRPRTAEGPRMLGSRVGRCCRTFLRVAARGGAAAARAASVDTRIGTQEGAQDFGTGGGAGATYPGAVAPFGMVQLSPDTAPGIDNPAGGYSYVDHQIKGFSLTHLSGAGCAGLSDVPLLPTTHAIDPAPSLKGSYDVNPRYVATYTHHGEVARPGDYRVRSTRAEAIRAELTARERAGALRATFPASAQTGSIVVNAGGSAMGNTLAGPPCRPGAPGDQRHRRQRRLLLRPRPLHPALRHPLRPAVQGLGDVARDEARARLARRKDSVPDPPGPLLLQYKRIGGGPKAVKGNPTKGAQAGAYATFATGARAGGRPRGRDLDRQRRRRPAQPRRRRRRQLHRDARRRDPRVGPAAGQDRRRRRHAGQPQAVLHRALPRAGHAQRRLRRRRALHRPGRRRPPRRRLRQVLQHLRLGHLPLAAAADGDGRAEGRLRPRAQHGRRPARRRQPAEVAGARRARPTSWSATRPTC